MKLIKRKGVFVLAAALALQCVSLVPLKVNASNSRNMKYGFKLIKKTYVSSINTTVMQYEHIKSGAKLVYLKNSDPNMTFSIGFRTLPSDNTGVNHIIEHSILDGSKKYHVNNAFMNMQKQSLSSMANASTASDHTTYYIETSNETDYMNNMDIILDGVFHPDFLHNKNIFLQEGGRYKLNADKTKANYTGVVYDEIGEDNPLDTLTDKCFESLLPDTPYKFVSGGTHEDIPNVTYKEVVSNYEKYYKPSNSYIYLYGKLNINKMLKYINNNYLSKFKKDKTNIKIPSQKPFKKPVNKTYYYNLDKEEADKNSTYLSENFEIGKITDTKITNSFDIMGPIITKVVSKALAHKGITLDEDCSGMYDISKQTFFSFQSGETNENKKQLFKQVITDALKSIVKKGINKNEIKTWIRDYKTSYSNSELDVNNGINTCMFEVFQSWLHDGDPAMYLDQNETINVLKRELKERYFEGLIKKYLINNKWSSVVTLKGKVGEKDKGTVDASTLSKKQFNQLEQNEENLEKWQVKANSEKALSTLPVLKTSELKLKIPKIDTSNIAGTKVMFTPVDTGKSDYSYFYFDTSMVDQDKIPYINLLCNILNEGDSKIYDKYNSVDGSNDATYGNIDFFANGFGRFDSASEYSPKIEASIATSGNNIGRSLELLRDIITSSNLQDKDKIKECMEGTLQSTNATYYRFKSYFSPQDAYEDNLNGYAEYNLLNKLYNNFDSNWSEIQKNLQQVYNEVFNKNNLITGFVGTKQGYEGFKKKLANFLNNMKAQKYSSAKYSFDDSVKNEAFVTGSGSTVSVNKGYNFKKLGFNYSGGMQVLNSIMDKYLNNENRSNGAYGGNSNIDADGNMSFSSARISDINMSFKIFDTLPNYLKNFKANSDEMMKYKIAAIKSVMYPDSEVRTARNYQQNLVMGKTEADYQKEWHEILNTKDSDINSMADMVQAVINKNVFCVQGSRNEINKNKSIFDRIIDLTK
ncbi:insulinase family protein [Clostridium oryzae]|uniref:Peptidase M16C associated n=1 Tax=Clostridium oryzae TaxID=1450648 RepID=A0A1V4IM67_9CLOT|nr:insulinase family protein [Clostridium oryzae]OPJ60959.1 peptidase M16C associated [Clostridium oryzae]